MAAMAPETAYAKLEGSKADKRSDKGKREGSKGDNRADRTLIGKHKKSRTRKTQTPIGFDDEPGGM